MKPIETSKLIQLAKDHLWLGFGRDASYYDQDGAILASAEGCFFVDAGGNRYLDTLGGQGTACLGFNNRRIINAMIEQLGTATQQVGGMPATIPAILLAEKIASLPPDGLTRTFFVNSGSEANDTAMKMARQYWKNVGRPGKYKGIVQWQGFCGCTMFTTAGSGLPLRRTAFEPLPAGFIHVNPPYCYRCPYDMSCPECGVQCAQEVRRAIEREGPSTVAFFLSELDHTHGRFFPPPEYIKLTRDICDRYQILMMIDEVATGFGKSGRWFESEYYGLVPDIMTIGKSLTGGHSPLAGVRVKKEIADTFSGGPERLFQHGFTYGGNAPGCAAGLATVNILQESDIISQAAEKSSFLHTRLKEIQQDSKIVGDVRVRGLMVGFELVKDRTTRERFPDIAALQKAVEASGRRHGINLLCAEGTILMSLPLVISYDELQFLCDRLTEVVDEIEKQFSTTT